MPSLQYASCGINNQENHSCWNNKILLVCDPTKHLGDEEMIEMKIIDLVKENEISHHDIEKTQKQN